MKARTPEAARLEADYLERVKQALADRDASEVGEVIQSLQEHIEEELAGDEDAEASLVRMANVLERLGPPEDYAQREDVESARATPVSSRMSGKAILGALTMPIAATLAAATVAVMRGAGSSQRMDVLALALVLAGMVVGFVLSLAAFLDIRAARGRLRGKGFAIFGLVLPLVTALVLLLLVLRKGRPGRDAYDRVHGVERLR